MALDKQTLKKEIKSALKAEQHETDANISLERLAAKLSDAIERYVKSGTVYTTGNENAQTGYIE